jgi:hypothetical protein
MGQAALSHACSFALQVALERVEPARAILKRFCTGAMYAPLCPTDARLGHAAAE